MPRIDLLLLALLAGYVFLITFNLTKFYHQRIERQRLIFNSAICGIFLSLIGLYVDRGLFIYLPELRTFLGTLIPIEYEGLNKLILIFLLSYPLALLLNLVLPNKLVLGYIIKSRGDDFEKLFWDSLMSKEDEDKLLMVSTSSDKVYVGYVNKISKPLGHPHINILPYFSGYRDKETRQFYITTDYLSVLEKMILEGNEASVENKMGIVIPKENIAMVSKFDSEVFNRFDKLPEMPPEQRL